MVELIGVEFMFYIMVGGYELVVCVGVLNDYYVGENIIIYFDMMKCYFFDVEMEIVIR